MAHNGEDPKNIQAYGGWSNIKTPMEIYVRTNREEMAAVTKRMGDCIIKSRNASVKVSWKIRDKIRDRQLNRE